MTPARQTAIGLTLAALIIGGWLALNLYGVFVFDLTWRTAWLAPLVIAALCWLSVGLFIVAHDAMHGTLAPGRPAVNRRVGGLSLLIYAGFWIGKLTPKHHDHHRYPGTERDPDFHAERPGAFWPWYGRFFTRYFGWREFAWVATLSGAYLLLGASLPNVLLFWATPALLSSLQLFTFGTWLPHRAEARPFADHHRARSSAHPHWLSLLTCFHFGGFHHEHHANPHLPWWRLPEARLRPAATTARA